MNEAPRGGTYRWPQGELTRVPYWAFRDPEIYAREQTSIFRGRTWHYLGLGCEIPTPGDFRVSQVGDVPVILSRKPDGEVSALVNRCAHRGSLVCPQERGNAKLLTCPYHNWSFDHDGRLVGVPFRRGHGGKGGMLPTFDATQHGLEKLRVVCRGGVVFGTFDATTPSFEDYVGPIMLGFIDRLFNRPVKVLGHYRQRLRNNWKLVFENTRDAYHASLLHLFFGSFGHARLTMQGEALLDDSGWHHCVYSKRQTDDIRGSEYAAGGVPSMKQNLKLKDPTLLEEWAEFPDGITNLVQTIFPTVAFQQITNCLGVRHLIPKGPDHSELVWTLLGYEDDDEAQTAIRVRQANLVGPAGLVSLEDGAITNFVHRGLAGSREDDAAVVELGGADALSAPHRVTENCVRGFWKGWRETMGL